MKKIFLNLFLLFSLLTQAQEKLSFKGVIVESDTSDPVSKARVEIKELGLTTDSNNDGMFTFETDALEGDYVVSILKTGYEGKVFLIKHRKGFKIYLKEIPISVDKREARRRRKIKQQEKAEAKKKLTEAKRKLAKAEKQMKEEAKLLEKQKRKLLKKNSVVVEYETVEKPEKDSKKAEKEIEEGIISENQKKYAKLLGVDPIELTSKEIYDFIDSWMGTPYSWGGETKEAIDCSAFTQRLFAESYDMYLERMAIKQFKSKLTEAFASYKNLKEGDLLFFGKDQFNITHVGVYLHNNKFVHATSSTVDGIAGVKISDLSHPHWAELLVSAGRRIKE